MATATRTQHETEIASALVLLFGQWDGRPFDRAAFEADVRDALLGTLLPVYAQSAMALARQLNVPLDEQIAEVNARRWEAKFLPVLAAEIAGTTDPMLDGAFSAARADMIGVTETTRAVTAAEMALVAYLATVPIEDGGGAMRATWVTMEDERVCPVCGPLHDAGIDVIGQTPPAHPRCRCEIFWVQAA